VAEPLAPGGYKGRCTFATDATLKARATLTGSGKLANYQGKFKILLACQQVGGAAGDCSVRVSIMIGGSTAGYPVAYLPVSSGIALQSHDAGPEWVDLTGDGYINIPFGQVAAADSLASDLVVSVWATRTGGASVLDLHQIVFLPVDEFGLDLTDPRSDTTSGSSALRGNSLLEIDGGIVQNRTSKKLIVGANYIMAETWLRGGNINRLRPGRQYRFYFVIMNYQGASWYVPPLVGGKGSALAVSLHAVKCFATLRGSA